MASIAGEAAGIGKRATWWMILARWDCTGSPQVGSFDEDAERRYQTPNYARGTDSRLGGYITYFTAR